MSTPANRPYLESAFGLDLRSLALFRVLLALVLLATLGALACDLTAFYSDAGVAPRSWAMALAGDARLSLHWLNGSTLFAALLLAVQMAAALCLLVGWRTRLATLVSFVLWVSLMSRNVAVITPGDSLIAGLLFWAMFLPLGARYSVEHALSDMKSDGGSLATWATAGLLLQLVAPLFFSALALYSDEPVHESHVLHYLLSVEGLTNPLGQWLLTQQAVLPTLSRLLIGFSWLLPVLVFAPVLTQALRAVAAAGLLIVCGLGIVVFDLGALPWAGLAALAMLPGATFWDALRRRDDRVNAGTLRIYYDATHALSQRMCRILQEFLLLPRAELLVAQETARTRSLMQANQSWVVIDETDQATMKWAALVTLIRRSPVFAGLTKPLSWLERPGNALYDFVVRHRAVLDRQLSRCMERAPMASPAHRWHLMAATLLILSLVHHFAGVRALPQTLGHISGIPLQTLQLDPKWAFFQRSVLQNDGWLLSVGSLADGSQVDASRTDFRGADVSKPAHAALAADGLRMLAYREHLWRDPAMGAQTQYAHYLCERWNDRHGDATGQRLRQITFVHMLERTPPPPAIESPIEQIMLGTYRCR